MMEVDKHIEKCLDLIEHDRISNRGEGKIYCNTNENLTKILKPEYIKDKNVLSVMASSDQVFTSYYYDAKSVETFDSNIFAYYFFFLKKWCLLASKNYHISAFNGDLLDYISSYKGNEEEMKAYYFWKNILMNIKDSLYYSNLFYKFSPFEVPYKNDIDNLVEKIKDVVPNYYHFNMYEPAITDKVYDTIILSNILEYLYEEDDAYYQEKAKIVVDNLRRMTHEGSIIISTNILDYDYKNNEIFEEYFKYEEGEYGFNNRYYNAVPLYYTYTKK